MLTVPIDDPGCLSVCLSHSITWLHCTNTTERIEVLHGVETKGTLYYLVVISAVDLMWPLPNYFSHLLVLTTDDGHDDRQRRLRRMRKRVIPMRKRQRRMKMKMPRSRKKMTRRPRRLSTRLSGTGYSSTRTNHFGLRSKSNHLIFIHILV